MEYDPILNRIQAVGLNNSTLDKVSIIFVPSYLNGDDGVFNVPYYDLLIGLDLTVFPSYYEPWGYTPLESVAFSVPTVTTSVTGFGLWVQQTVPEMGHGACVIERNDTNDVAGVVEIQPGTRWAVNGIVRLERIERSGNGNSCRHGS